MKYFPEGFPHMPDRIAERRLEYFFEQFVMQRFDRYGFGHFALACYAALPSVLTPDLLHKLWLNFKPYRLQGQTLNIHPVAPADILLSPLLEEIGYELYEMVPPVRKALLGYLQLLTASPDKNILGFQPLTDVAQFLLEYARRDQTHGNANNDAFREAQEWTALSYLDPSAAFAKVAKAFANTQNLQERLRYRDAIEKMASRFEVEIYHPGAKPPEGYPAMRALTQVMRDLAMNRAKHLKEYETLFEKPELLSDKPLQLEAVVDIEMPQEVQERLAETKGKVVRKVRALVVGVGKTQEERLSVQEGEQEARIFADCLKELILPVNLDIQVLTGKAATKKAILDAWGAMVDGAKAQDDLLFYISSNSTLIDDNHCLVVCYDTLSNSMDTSSWLSDSDFEAVSRRAVASSITAVLAVNHAATPHWLDQSDDRNVVFATCKQAQVPYLIQSEKAGDSIYYSFTYALVKALQETKLLASNRSIFIRALRYFEAFEPVRNTYGSQLREKHAPQIIASSAALNRFFLNENKTLVSLQNRLRDTGFYHQTSSGIWDASTATATKAAKKHLQLNEELTKQAIIRQLEGLKERQEEEQKPILLFVFGDLPAVKREKIAVSTIMRKTLEGAHAELLVLDNPTKEEFSKAFSRKDRRNRVHWFHFAGLERDRISRLDAPTGFMLKDGLFKLNEFLHLLEFQENIRGAFLNTCFSEPLAEWLTRLGVQAAIGATGFLNDDYAADFSEHFYQGLAHSKGIKEAIDGYKSGEDYGSIYRIGIKPEGIDSKKNNLNLFTAPWALKDILGWRLASYHLKSSTPEIALRLIHENKKNRAKKLDLGNCGLREIPAEVFELEWLEELILSNLRYEYEPQRGEWVKIFSRNEGGRNRLSKISREISKLQNLRKLVIGGAKGEKWEIASLRPLSTLSNLQYLDIVGNRISNLAPLKGLIKLVVLDISDNLVQTLEALKGLSNLNMLGARFNQIKSLEPLRHLTKLTHLDVGFNQLYFLEGVEKLLELKEILAPRNQLATIDAVSALAKLEVLKVWGNELTSLDPLENLPSLAVVHVHRNKIGSIEPLFPLLKKGMRISWEWSKESQIVVGENPTVLPPVEVVKGGEATVLTWMNSFYDEKSKPKHYLHEIKLFILGEGMTGKTSLLKRIKGLPFNNYESQTHGLNVEILELDKLPLFKNYISLTGVKIRIWDFGGQEIMHASHQIFLSHRSIYVLLLDSRNDAKKEYWLRHIAKFGGGSPCIVVINKIDENPNYDLARNTLNEAFDFIGQRFCRISCKTGEGLDNFAATLARLITETELYKTPISEDWLNVKNQLEAATTERNYIDRQHFLYICERNNVTDTETQQTLLRYLDNLGVVLHFPNLRLQAFYVLDPHWVTIGVYKIINSPSIEGGILKEEKLHFILNVEEQKTEEYGPNRDKRVRYTPDEQLYLVSIMEEFELLYPYAKGQWLVPDLLPKEPEQQLDWDESEAVVFLMDYDFLPPNVMSRFIIRMKTDVRDISKVWRTGVVLENAKYKCSALVTADLDKQRIRISVNGEAHRKREYFSTIRHTFHDIQEGLNLVVSEKMPVSGNLNVEVDFDDLLAHEAEGIDEYFIGKLRKKFSVSKDFLDKVSTKTERQNKEINVHIYDASEDLEDDIKHIRHNIDKTSSQIETVLESLEKQLSLTQAQQQEVHAIYESLDKSTEADAVFERLNALMDDSFKKIETQMPNAEEFVEKREAAMAKLPDITNVKWKLKIKMPLLFRALEAEVPRDTKATLELLRQEWESYRKGEKSLKELLIEKG